MDTRGSADLLESTMAQHGQPVGQRHGFELVVRYINHRGFQFSRQLSQPAADFAS